MQDNMSLDLVSVCNGTDTFVIRGQKGICVCIVFGPLHWSTTETSHYVLSQR
jgi:hypothetical protein